MSSSIRTIENHSVDKVTADAFAKSWNNLPEGSVYTPTQIEDWFSPICKKDIENRTVLELGCGNGSLLAHLPRWRPQYIEGVDLGDSILSCKRNMHETGFQSFKVTQADLIDFQSQGFDVVYSIGVLHHLKEPTAGFRSVLRNTRPGGKFHCWVYAEEGNKIVITLVEPIRKIVSRLPWWFTKFVVATPLAIPFFLYAHLISRSNIFSRFPLHEYCTWITTREFRFFRHVAFDQLVTPQTSYISRDTVETWLSESEEIEPGTSYLIFRNGNSWKFGGVKRSLPGAG
jgi:SAM-dependent methyltransferase